MRKAGRQVGAKKEKKRVRGETNAWVWGVVAVSGAPGSQKGRGRRLGASKRLKESGRGEEIRARWLARAHPRPPSYLSPPARNLPSHALDPSPRAGPLHQLQSLPISPKPRRARAHSPADRHRGLEAPSSPHLPTSPSTSSDPLEHQATSSRLARSPLPLPAAPSRFFVVLHPSRSTSPVDTSTQLLRRRLLASPARA